MKIVIVCESWTGQTAKIAGYIQQHLNNRGHQAELVQCRGRDAAGKIEEAEAVVIGAPVRAGNYHSKAIKFIKTNLDLLNKKKNAFFTVCLSAKSDDDKSKAEIAKYHEGLKEKTGWQPQALAAFAGGIAYTRYNFLIKFIIKKINQKEGGDTDTTRDYEYTDWDKVKAFADGFTG